MKAYIEEYVPEMREEVVNLELREEDKKEVEASLGLTPKQAIEESLGNSSVTWVIKYGEKIIAVFGVVVSELPGVGMPWLLGSQELHDIKFRIIKYSGLIVEQMLFIEGVKCLTNIVSTTHTEAIKWLEWLGFKFINQSIKLNGVDFLQFYKWKKGEL